MNKFIKILAKILIASLGLWCLGSSFAAIYGVSIYFPFYISDGIEMPYHRLISLRVTILLTFSYYSLKYIISESRQLYPIQFLDTILKIYFFSGLAIGIRFNIASSEFTPWLNSDGSNSGTSILQLGGGPSKGVGFHIYRMTPGSSSEAHQHRGDEEFFVIDGSLRDNDGTVYVKGDLVLLRDGTQHFSVSDDGCLLAVYIPKVEVNL